jgi:4-amino-4-deoxy-L-arabinose transferase-like glycosyltransferase
MRTTSELQPIHHSGDEPATGLPERSFYGFLIVLAVVRLWVLPIRSSFWKDEAGTYWIVKDGLANVIPASFDWSQFPLYYVMAWLAHLAGGRSEVILRLPSLLAMILAAGLLYKLAARLFDADTAPLAILVFACSEQVAFAAADARPYALGLCLLIASAWMLVCWLDSGRPLYAAGYWLLATFTIYTHALLAIALAGHGIYALYRSRREGAVRPAALLATWIATGLLLLPVVPRLLESFRTRGSHAFAGAPNIGEFLASVAPPVLTAPLGLSLLIGWLVPASRSFEGDRKRVVPPENVFLTACWALLPPAACYVFSVFTRSNLFQTRYYVAAAPGLALLFGWWIRRVAALPARPIAAAVLVIGASLSYGGLLHGDEDWAGAMAKVRALTAGGDTPVLMAGGFLEATDPEALTAPRWKEVLFAPLALYPAGGKLIRLPFRLDEKSTPYLETIVAGDLQERTRFVLVCERGRDAYELWLRGRLAPQGFRSASQGNFGDVLVFLFSREPAGQ